MEYINIGLETVVAHIMVSRMKRRLEPVIEFNKVQNYIDCVNEHLYSRCLVVFESLSDFKAKNQDLYDISENTIRLREAVISSELRQASTNCMSDLIFIFGRYDVVEKSGILD